MSHIGDMEVHIKDLAALEAAASRLGLELVKGQTAYKWYGRSVGDYPLPAGFAAEDLGKCEHALRIPGDNKAYEIGVVKRRDGKPGFQLLWDFWQGGFGLTAKIGETGGLLKQAYAIEATKKQMIRDGYRVTETVSPQGNALLTFVE